MIEAQKAGLEDADYRTAEDRSMRLSMLAVDRDELLGIIDEWESRQLIASKRILATIAISLALVHVLGVDYSEIDLFLVGNLESSQAFKLSIFLGALLSGFLVAYVLNLWGDRSARQARVDSVSDELEEGMKIVDQLHKLIGRDKFPRVFVQSKRTGFSFDFYHKAGEQYQLVDIFRKKIKGVDRLRYYLNYAESCVLSLISGFALGGIIRYWLVGGGVLGN